MTTTSEAYVHLSIDEITLTFYCDTLRADRNGTTWGISDVKHNFFPPSPLGLVSGTLSMTPCSLLSLMLRSVIFAQPPRHDGFTASKYLKA